MRMLGGAWSGCLVLAVALTTPLSAQTDETVAPQAASEASRPASATSASGDSHTLPELQRAAQRSSPAVQAVQHKIAAAEAQLDEAWVSPFFQFEATGSVALAPHQQGNPIFSPDSQLPLGNEWGPVGKIGVQGAVPLWTFGKLEGARDAARAGVEAAEHERAKTRAELRFDVRRAYFALQLALDSQQMLVEGNRKLDDALERLDEMLETDDASVTQMDRYRLAAARSEVRARESEVERLERSSREALEILTDLEDVRVPECPSQPLPMPDEPLDWYQRAAQAHRPEAHMLDAAIDARQANVDVNQARYFPDLALALQASTSRAPGITDQNNPFVQDPANYNSLGAALVARWSLDLWGNVYRVERAERELLQTQAQRRHAFRGMGVEVGAAYAELQDAKRRLEAWEEGERDTRKWFVTAAQGYQVGTVEPRELVDAIRAYFGARFKHLQAIHDYNVAVAKLERVVGMPLLDDQAWNQSCEPLEAGIAP